MEMKSLNVLLVEDDPASQRLVELTLSKQNEDVAYNLEVAGDLKTARKCLNDRKYDSILLDLHLPDSRGVDTVQAIKEIDSETPLIVLSAISIRVNSTRSSSKEKSSSSAKATSVNPV